MLFCAISRPATATPPLTRFSASLRLISFWVALGNAQSALWAHSGL